MILNDRVQQSRRVADPDKERLRRREWYARNRHHVLEQKKDWWHRNRERVRSQQRARLNTIRYERKVMLIEMLGGQCDDCGESFPGRPEVFEFDHLEPAHKSHGIARMLAWSVDRLLAEVEKCDLVCSNCHHTRTATRGWGNAETQRDQVAAA
jgi:hypothetical protein